MEEAIKVVQQAGGDANLAVFANRLTSWLLAEIVGAEGSGFPESRAKAVLRATNALDDPTLHSFARLVESAPAARVALYDLLATSGLGQNGEVAALAAASSQAPGDAQPIGWLSLALAAYAWKSGYPLQALDPAAPPENDSPAGLVVRRAAHFVRQQVQRGATERDKLARKLSQPPSGAPTLEGMAAEAPIPPLPPIYRPPVPVRYPEYSRETVRLEPENVEEPPAAPSRGEPLVIRPEDLQPPAETRQPPVTNPPIRISREQIPSEPPRPPRPLPRSAVVMPNSAVESRPSLTVSVRQMLGQEALKSTRLRVKVQEYPDGPGVYGLQVKVTCAGIKSYVAGTTDREGTFVCELPVRINAGLTYDVDVTWPRDMGGDTERKSITLNADRTEFNLPFYRQLRPTEEGQR
jgi:hypothetical protein